MMPQTQKSLVPAIVSAIGWFEHGLLRRYWARHGSCARDHTERPQIQKKKEEIKSWKSGSSRDFFFSACRLFLLSFQRFRRDEKKECTYSVRRIFETRLVLDGFENFRGGEFMR